MGRRVLFISDAGCHTGFGRVTHSIGDRLVETFGHEINVLAINHRGDPWDTSMQLWPAMLRAPGDIYGLARVIELLEKTMPEVVVIVNDQEVVLKYLFQNKFDPSRILLNFAPILTYTPVDGINNPPAWNVLGDYVTRVAMTKFGQDLLPASELIYHGVDTELYRPVSDKRPIITSGGEVITSKRDAKRALGYDPEGFLVLRVDRNSSRKNFPDTWKALVPVVRNHKDIQVHFHCQARGDYFAFPNILSREPDVANQFFFPDEQSHNTFMGWPDNDLAVLYNAADVFVSTAWSEGFGLTIAEAMACGIPVIAQNCSAITEVVGPGGVLIEPLTTITAPTGQDQWIPNVGLFTEAIEKLYLSKGARRDLGHKAREHVVANFSWDTAASQFNDLIERLASTPRKGKEPDAGAEAAPVQDRDGGSEGRR
jgi:glycosyltransferase involved in cell wall biosynthesis